MNHPSEWARYYDAPNGAYRYRHKGTGVVRDTLMNIGKRFKKKVTRQTLEKAVNEASKQMLKKAEEKAADKIQAVLRSGVSNSVADPRPQGKKTPSVKPKGKKTPPQTLSTESKQKLKKMLNPGVWGLPHSQLSGDSRKKLQQILNLGRAAKLKVNQLIAEN